MINKHMYQSLVLFSHTSHSLRVSENVFALYQLAPGCVLKCSVWGYCVYSLQSLKEKLILLGMACY